MPVINRTSICHRTFNLYSHRTIEQTALSLITYFIPGVLIDDLEETDPNIVSMYRSKSGSLSLRPSHGSRPSGQTRPLRKTGKDDRVHKSYPLSRGPGNQTSTSTSRRGPDVSQQSFKRKSNNTQTVKTLLHCRMDDRRNARAKCISALPETKSLSEIESLKKIYLECSLVATQERIAEGNRLLSELPAATLGLSAWLLRSDAQRGGGIYGHQGVRISLRIRSLA